METNKERIIKVLAVDDSETLRKDLENRLLIREVEVTAFSSGEELLSKLAAIKETEELPTAVLMDYILGNNNSEPIIAKLREQHPWLPIIIYSGLDLRGSIKAYGMGAYALMQKPLDFSELVVILKELANTDALTTGLARDLCEITEFDTCLVWQLNKKYNDYRVTGFHGADREFAFNTLMTKEKYQRIEAFIKERDKYRHRYYADVTSELIEEKQDYAAPDIARDRGWVSLISLPFYREGRLMGWFDCYSRKRYEIKGDREKKLTYLHKYAKQAGEALHSTLLTKQSRIIHEISQNLAVVSDENLVYDTILEKAIEFTGANCGWIYAHNIELKQIERIRFCGEGAEKADVTRPLDQGGITGAVVVREHSIYVPDIEIEVGDWYKPGTHVATSELEEKSVIAIPLRRGERTLGVLTLSSRHEDFFTPDENQLLTSLAAIAAVGMERSKLTRHLKGLSDIARTAKDFKPIAEYVVNAARDLTHADVNLLMTRVEEEDGDDFMRIVAHSKKDKDYEKGYVKSTIVPTDPEKGVSAKALFDNRYIIVNDIEKYDNQPPFITKPFIKKYDWRSFMSVPLVGNNGERLGVISLYSKMVNRFNDDEGKLVQHFADQAAQVLQEQRRTQVFQELARASQELSIGLSGSGALLSKVAKLARNFAKADIAVIYPYDATHKKYYDAVSVVVEGPLKVRDKTLTNKPRDNGLAAFIRKHEALIVEDTEDESSIPMYVGLGNTLKCQPGTEKYDLPVQLIRESSFIKREGIKAFVGVSLQAKEVRGRGKEDVQHEVAILYFNYHAPRHFSAEELQFIDIFCRQVANIIHRDRLFFSLKRERQVLDAVHQSTLHILEEHEEEQLLEKIVEEAVKLLNAAGGKIYLPVNGSRRDLKLAAAKGLPPERVKIGKIMPNTEGMAGEVLLTCKYLIVDDYAKYPRHIREFADLFTAVLEVPMKIGEEVIGVLGVFDNKDKRRFKEKDAEMLSRLSAQAALAISNLKLNEELSALYQTGLQIATQAPLKKTTENILTGLKKVIDYDKATIQSIQDIETPRKILAFDGEGSVSSSDHLLRPVRKDDLVWPIYQKKSPSILSDTHEDPNWEKGNYETIDVRSWACLPLVYGDDVLGLLILDHKQPGYYTQQDLPQLERFANQAAIALHNASIEQKLINILGDFSNYVIHAINERKSKEHIFNKMLISITEAIEHAEFVYYPTDLMYMYLEQSKNIKIKSLTIEEGIANWVAQEKEVKLIPIEAPSALIKKESGKQKRLYGPLLRAGEIIGVLEVASEGSEFEDFQKSFLSSLLTIAGNTIYQIEHRKRRIELIKIEFNPYYAGLPVRDPEHFYGRAEVLKSILNGIQNNVFIIEAARRTGKTSVLYQIEYHLKKIIESSYVYFPVFIDLEGTEERDFWKQMIISVQYSLEGNMPMDLSQDYSYFDFISNIRIILAKLEKAYPNKKVKIIFLADECDIISNYQIKTLAQYRKLFQIESRLGVIMAGRNVHEAINEKTSPWHNQLIRIRLPHFSHEDSILLIKDPVKEVYSFHPDAINLIIDKCQNEPYQIQGICYHSVQAMLSRIKVKENDISRIIILEDVKQAILAWEVDKTKNY